MGNEAFELLIKNLHGTMTPTKQYYRIDGFLLAVQVLLYECCSVMDTELAVKRSDHIPRIINWETKKSHPCCDHFMKEMFRHVDNLVTFRNIAPTSMEIAILTLPPEYVKGEASSTKTPIPVPSDDDFQDPPILRSKKGKEKVFCSSSPPRPPTKKLRSPVQRISLPK